MTTSPVTLNSKSIQINGNTLAIDASGKLIINNVEFSATQLFTFQYFDYLIDAAGWVNADAFNWLSSSNYPNAYNHLVADIDGKTAETETIGSYTITFYRATDGHKICLANQETTVSNIFTETGVAWYYILDTENTRFKLPREYYSGKGVAGNGMTLGLTNGSDDYGLKTTTIYSYSDKTVTCLKSAVSSNIGTNYGGNGDNPDNITMGITLDPTKSGMIISKDSTKYLMFYIN